MGVGVWRSVTEYYENSDKTRYRRVGEILKIGQIRLTEFVDIG